MAMAKAHNNGSGNTFHQRLFVLFMAWQGKQGRKVEQSELGTLVGKALKRRPFTQATVSRWFTTSIPSLETIEGLAKVMGSTPGWLAFGEGEPPDDPATPMPMPRPRVGSDRPR